MKRFALILSLVVLAQCGPLPQPHTVPLPPSAWSAESRTEAIHLGVAQCAVTLEQDGQAIRTQATDASGSASFLVTMLFDARGNSAPGTLNLAASATCEGYEPWRASWVAAAHGNQDVCASAEPCGPNQGITLPGLVAVTPPLQRLHVAGRGWATADGQPWAWRGITAFRLVEQVAHGRAADAEAFLARAEAQHLTLVRVLAMAKILFALPPADGVRALPSLLDLAAKHGLHVEVVALADTVSYPDLDIRSHVQQIGAICGSHPACVLELGNEITHATQSSRVHDLSFIRSLRALVPPSVPTALGSAQEAIEAPDPFCVLDYCTVHSDRAAGEGGWRKVRHVKDAVQDTADRVKKPVINDEPWRADQDPDPAKQRALSWLEDGFQIGGTFHCSSCLQGVWPTGAELAALDARVQGWDDLAAWRGVYANVGWASSPVKSADFSRVARVYSSVSGGSAYTFVLGLSGAPMLAWAWPTRRLLVDLGSAQLWRATR